jgi:hypothetical protein
MEMYKNNGSQCFIAERLQQILPPGLPTCSVLLKGVILQLDNKLWKYKKKSGWQY